MKLILLLSVSLVVLSANADFNQYYDSAAARQEVVTNNNFYDQMVALGCNNSYAEYEALYDQITQKLDAIAFAGIGAPVINDIPVGDSIVADEAFLNKLQIDLRKKAKACNIL